VTSGRIRTVAWVGTATFAVTAVAAAAVPGLFAVAALVVAGVLFAAGCVAFLWAYATAVGRSRAEQVSVVAVYLLTGKTAPPDVRRSLLGALGVQVAVALGTAIARPYTSLAAGTLVPMFGLGLCGLWGARHGTFPPRPGR
jgi:hypothetical protein